MKDHISLLVVTCSNTVSNDQDYLIRWGEKPLISRIHLKKKDKHTQIFHFNLKEFLFCSCNIGPDLFFMELYGYVSYKLKL